MIILRTNEKKTKKQRRERSWTVMKSNEPNNILWFRSIENESIVALIETQTINTYSPLHSYTQKCSLQLFAFENIINFLLFLIFTLVPSSSSSSKHFIFIKWMASCPREGDIGIENEREGKRNNWKQYENEKWKWDHRHHQHSQLHYSELIEK